MAGRGLRVWSSLSGLVFVVLAVVGSALLFEGPSDSSPAKMAAWYGSDSHRWHINLGWILAGLGLSSLTPAPPGLFDQRRTKAIETMDALSAKHGSSVIGLGGVSGDDQ